jgi:hypothetical protein
MTRVDAAVPDGLKKSLSPSTLSIIILLFKAADLAIMVGFLVELPLRFF